MKKEKWELSKQIGRDIHDNPFFEAICPHGVGHHKGVHGCHAGDDGKSCCSSCPPEIWDKVTKD